MSSQSPQISVVMPAFNECESLPDTVAAVVSNLRGQDYEIIIVDDGSSDGTWAVIELLSQKYKRLKGLKFSRNFGHQSALLAGLTASRARR